MSKYKVRMKLTGFELEIEGEKETVGQLGQALRTQMSNALLPPLIASGSTLNGSSTPLEDPKTIEGKVSRRNTKRRSNSSSNGETVSSIIEFQHDPIKYGNPLQNWRPVEKSMWLIYVMSKQIGVDKFTPTEIAETYNAQFGKTGTLRPSNVSRDLGKAKSGNPAFVSQDIKTQKFGLYEAGEKEALKLIGEAQNQNTGA